MTTKQKVINSAQGLPKNASYEDAMERLLFLAKVEKGLHQADAGQTISHEAVKRRIMIIPMLGAALLIPTAAHSSPQSARVERVSIVEQGILIARIDAPSVAMKASDGQDVSIERPSKYIPAGNTMRPSPKIPGLVGTTFGYRFKIHGQPRQAPVKLDIVIHYPPPGRRDMETGRLSRISTIPLTFKIGQEAYNVFEFSEAADIVPGEWILEIRKGNRSLARAAFIVAGPNPPELIHLTPDRP